MHNKHKYIQSLMDDLDALQYMLDHAWIEEGVQRIGAEQELVLVDSHARPTPKAPSVIAKHKDIPWLAPELSQFNLEINLDPLKLYGHCFSTMESQLLDKIEQVREMLSSEEAAVILCGVLPTMRKNDMDLKYLSPYERYAALIKALKAEHKGHEFELRLSGIDELHVQHESALLEACNTSFQVHLQVDANNFMPTYIASQIIAAPLLATAVNSPIVFGRRLWHESRIALFQQSIDTRRVQTHMRERSPRVMFGNGWNYHSILDIYKEDISKFDILFPTDLEKNSTRQVKNGEYPDLKALKLFNSTIYRWNRPCFGCNDGKAHLRIENRVLPAGPSVVDEVANSAFWIGSVLALRDRQEDLRQRFSFVNVRDNFAKASRYGLDSFLSWEDNKKIPVNKLLLQELIPMASEALKSYGVESAEVDKYMNVIRERTEAHMTGARWSLMFYSDLLQHVNRSEACYHVTRQTFNFQKQNLPVHKWEIPKLEDLENFDFKTMKVDEFMTTEVFTVGENDVLNMAAEIMRWNKLDYLVVEDDQGKVAGILDENLVIGALLERNSQPDDNILVKNVMLSDVAMISPEEGLQKAYDQMTKSGRSCIVVCENDKEVRGIISKHNFYYLVGRVLTSAQ